MKILMINKFLYPRGGAESYMLQLGESFEKAGHEVQYFGMFDKKNTVGNSSGLYTQNMDFHSSSAKRFLYPFKIIYSRDTYRKLVSLIKSFKPDIVHMNNINFQLTPAVIYAVKKFGIPLVQTVHDYQMICPNHLLYNYCENQKCEKCINGSKFNCLKYKCIHGSKIKSLIGTVEACLYKALKTYRLVDLFICPSDFLNQKLCGADKIFDGKTFTLHNFIDKTKIKKSAPLNPPYIVYAGRFSREKGIELLAETAKLLPEYTFKAAGSGPGEDILENIPNINLTGFLTGNALAEVISGATALIAPSLCFENCPLSILEAHSASVPVITMNFGGMAELVKDGVTGTLISSPAPHSAAEAVKKAMNNADLLRHGCEKHAEKILSADDYREILTEKYLKLMNHIAQNGEENEEYKSKHNSPCI